MDRTIIREDIIRAVTFITANHITQVETSHIGAAVAMALALEMVVIVTMEATIQV